MASRTKAVHSICGILFRSSLRNQHRVWGAAGSISNRKHLSTVHRPLPKASYGGRHTVALLPGDGVGPELMQHVKEIFSFTGVPVDFETVEFNNNSSEQEIRNAFLAVKRNGVALKGNVETQIDNQEFKALNLAFRAELGLFANVVLCKSQPGVVCRHKDIDLVVIRENTEGEYSHLEHESVGGVVESIKIITEVKSTRIAHYAFEYAMQQGRKKVTAVHKANIMKMTDGLFLECCRKVSEEYPEIEFDAMIVDNCSMQLVSRPQQFDVMVLPNLYGNIIANIAAGLVGGPGIIAGSNIGQEYAVFETGTRNSEMALAGKNSVNPSAMLLTSADMLTYLGLVSHGERIRTAVCRTLNVDKVHTQDLCGTATSEDVILSVKRNIASAMT